MEEMLLSGDELREKAKELRKMLLTMIYKAQSGHPGGSLSATDIVASLYFHTLRVDPKNPKWEDRDRFVLSKGHVCPVLYSALIMRGFISEDTIGTLRKQGSILQGHPDMKRCPGIEISTGSLGQGISCAVGMAIAGKMDEKEYRVYTLLGDGECDEGQIWEGAQFAAHYKLDNLVCLVDNNGRQLDGAVADVMSHGKGIGAKFDAFGWNVIDVADGNDVEQILGALEQAKACKGKPTCLILNTVKGKGATFAEPSGAHSSQPTKEQWDEATAASEAALAAVKNEK